MLMFAIVCMGIAALFVIDQQQRAMDRRVRIRSEGRRDRDRTSSS